MDKRTFTISLTGRIDASNVSDVENEVVGQIKAHAGCVPVFDAKGLQYISSAGLRMLLKIKKQEACPLEIQNVSPEVFEIFEVTGFNQIFDVKKAYRRISVDGCAVLGEGFFGKVYRLDEETVVKVYHSPDSIPNIEREREMARKAFIQGIPTAISYDIVQVGDSYGSVFEMLKADNFNRLLIEKPQEADQLIRCYVDFLKQIHSIEMEPGELPMAVDIYLGYLEEIRSYLEEGFYDKMKELLMAMPTDLHFVHGDYQMKNVMMVDGSPMLIDMETISTGHPVFDLQGLYITYQEFQEDDPDNAERFLGISSQMSEYVWKRILEWYVGETDPDELERIEEKIRVVSAIRFLFIITSSELKNHELGRIQIRRTNEHLREILPHIDELVF